MSRTDAVRGGVAPSTVHRILSSAGLNWLSHVDPATGEPVRRYEHDHAGSLIHVDVKKLGNIPDGGGWRFVGRQQGAWNRQSAPGNPKSKWHENKMGHAFGHTVIDDHSRVAYAEVHDDETAITATGSRSGRLTGSMPAASLSNESGPAGSTTTIATGPTQPAVTSHPSHD